MGFSGIPARPDQAQAVAAIQMWSGRADGAIWHEEPPWSELLLGLRADSLVRARFGALAQYYRARGLTLTFEIDPTNGLDRAAESESLRVHGLSIAMPAVQAAFLRFASAVDTILAPDYLGLASETNLVRLAAPAPLYQAMKQLANATADSLTALHARRSGAHPGVLYSTVQVDVAWGRLGGSGAYVGIAADLADFPFARAVGLSAYPYLAGFTDPDSLPPDWFARLAREAGKPVMVVEGGWTSASLASAGLVSSPAKQARYVRRMSALLDRAAAIGWYQLTFPDLDLAVFARPRGFAAP